MDHRVDPKTITIVYSQYLLCKKADNATNDKLNGASG